MPAPNWNPPVTMFRTHRVVIPQVGLVGNASSFLFSLPNRYTVGWISPAANALVPRERHGRTFWLPLVIFQRRNFHQCAFRAGAVHGLAVVPNASCANPFRATIWTASIPGKVFISAKPSKRFQRFAAVLCESHRWTPERSGQS